MILPSILGSQNTPTLDPKGSNQEKFGGERINILAMGLIRGGRKGMCRNYSQGGFPVELPCLNTETTM